MTVLVEARCRCRKVAGNVVEFEGRLLWEAAEFEPPPVDHSGSTRSTNRARRLAVAIADTTPEERRPTDDCAMDEAPEILRGWCPDDGAPPFERAQLLAAAMEARKRSEIRRVVVQRW